MLRARARRHPTVISREVHVLAFVVAALASVSAQASAAPSAREQAKTQIAAGVRMLENHDFTAALARFKDAYASFPSPKILYNMGLAYQGLHQPARAYAAFDGFLRESHDQSPQRDHARQEMENLTKQVGLVSLSSDVPEVELLVDGASLGRLTLPGTVPLESGEHEIMIRTSVGSESRRVTATAGNSIDIHLEIRAANAPASTPSMLGLPPPPTGSPPAAEPVSVDVTRPATASKGSSDRWLRPARWTAAGAAVAATGVGIYFNVRSSSKRSSFNDFGASGTGADRCGTHGDTVVGPPECAGLADSFKSARRNAMIFYATGGVLAVTAAILFLASERLSDKDGAAALLAPGGSLDPLGTGYTVRF